MSSKFKISRKIPSYLNRSSKGGLLVGFIYVIAFMSILFLAIWQTFESENNKSSLQLVDERLSLIEEQINIVDETNNDSMTDITSSIQFLDKEIRKLWDLSNKKNKKDISVLSEQNKVISDEIFEVQNSSASNTKSLEEIDTSLKNIKTRLAKLSSFELNSSGYSERLAELEEAMLSIDAYRKQTNQSISEIKKELSADPVLIEAQ